MQDFLQQNASAVFGVIGALSGGLLTFLGSWFLVRRDYNFRLQEKIINKRISAHEKIISLAMKIRNMELIGGEDRPGELRRSPSIMVSKSRLDQFTLEYNEAMGHSTWLSISVTREMNFLQDYMLNLEKRLLTNILENTYPFIGNIIRQDFIDFSSSIEKKANAFFQNGIRKLKHNDLNKWHKYKQAVTKQKLDDTVLYKKWDDILVACQLETID